MNNVQVVWFKWVFSINMYVIMGVVSLKALSINTQHIIYITVKT